MCRCGLSTPGSPLRREEIRRRLLRRLPQQKIVVRSRTKPDGLGGEAGIIVALQLTADDAAPAQRQATDVVMRAMRDSGIATSETHLDVLVSPSP